MINEETISRLKELKNLLDEGILTPEEVEQEKKKLLNPEQYKESDNNASSQTNRVEEPHSKKLNGNLLIWILGVCLLVAVALLLFRDKGAKTVSSAPSPSVSVVKEEENIQQQLVSLVNRWCECHSKGDVQTLSQLYGPQVKFYQSDYSRETVLDSKQKAFAKPGDYRQNASNIRVEKRPDGTYKVFFTKQTASGNYPSYVSAQKINGSWKIVEESDFVTDKNLAKRKLAQMSLLAEDTNYGYYSEVIRKGTDEFDLDEKKLYQYNKQTYEVKYLLTCGDELATSLTPLSGNGEKVKVASIDDIQIISPSVIILSGCPDYRNTFSYVFNTESSRCSFIEADLGYGGIRNENGQSVIVATERHYGDDGPEIREKIFDMDGKFLRYGKNLGKMFDD